MLGSLLCALAQTPSPRPPGEAPVTEFVAFLALTVVLLVLTVWTGKTHRRKPHYVVVAIMLVVLTITIRYAEKTGSYWNFPALPLRIHLSLAYTATVATLVASISGLLHTFRKISRKAHTRLAWLALLFIFLATCTGIWIFTVGEAKV